MDNNTTATVGGQTGQTATDIGNRTGQNSSDSTVNDTNSTANNTGSTSAERTYTAAELEAEVDRRVNQAQLKWAAGLDEKLSAAKTEGEKLAKMTADQRAKAEFEQQRTNFEPTALTVLSDITKESTALHRLSAQRQSPLRARQISRPRRQPIRLCRETATIILQA